MNKDKIHHQHARGSHFWDKFLILVSGVLKSGNAQKGKKRKTGRGSTASPSPNRDPSVSKALEFIRSRFADAIQVTDVAQHVGLSRRALERRFFLHCQSSPAKEIWEARITKAKTLLQDSNHTVAEVAKASGFASLEYFRTYFRSKTGLTPRKYRVESLVGNISPADARS